MISYNKVYKSFIGWFCTALHDVRLTPAPYLWTGQRGWRQGWSQGGQQNKDLPRVSKILAPALHILRIHQRKILYFILGSSRPRVNRQILFTRRINGGLSAPNLHAYYVAANLVSVSYTRDLSPSLMGHFDMIGPIDMIHSHLIPLSTLPCLPPSSHPIGISPSLSHKAFGIRQAWSHPIYPSYASYTAH